MHRTTECQAVVPEYSAPFLGGCPSISTAASSRRASPFNSLMNVVTSARAFSSPPNSWAALSRIDQLGADVAGLGLDIAQERQSDRRLALGEGHQQVGQPKPALGREVRRCVMRKSTAR